MNKGISLYFALIVLAAMTGVLLALITLSVSQMKIADIQADSTIAFFAADTGIEKILYKIRNEEGYNPEKGECPYNEESVGNDVEYAAKYTVCVSDSSTTTIQSIGAYQGIQRKIEIDISS